jgi:hypothetical protein
MASYSVAIVIIASNSYAVDADDTDNDGVGYLEMHNFSASLFKTYLEGRDLHTDRMLEYG